MGLILTEAEGAGVTEAKARPGAYRVQDYAMAADQAEALKVAMVTGRRLPRRIVGGFWLLWAAQSPCDYEDE